MVDNLRNIFFILTKQQRKKTLILLILILFNSIIEVFGIGLVFPLLVIVLDKDAVQNYDYLNFFADTLKIQNHTNLIVILFFLILLFFLFRFIFMISFAWFQNRFVYFTTANLSERILERFLFAPWNIYIKKNSGELIRSINSDVSIYSRMSLLSLLNLIREVFFIISILFLLIFFSFKLTIFSIAFFASFSLIAYFFLKNKIYLLSRQRHLSESKRNKELLQTLSAVKDLKIMGNERTFLGLFNITNYQTANVWQKQNFFSELPKHFLEFFTICFVIFALYFYLNFSNLPNNSYIPILGVFGVSAVRLIPSFGRFLTNLQNLKFSKISTNSLIEIFEKFKLENLDNSKKFDDFKFKKEIHIKHVTYKHEDKDENTLQNLEIKINKGEIVGIIGESGSGKSTLIDLILGLIVPQKGSIKVDGVDIYRNLKGWRKNIGYVSQNLFLLDDSIKKNITFKFNDEDIDEEKLKKIVKNVQLESFIDSLPDGLQTEVGERGVRISGGEKQRIVIARILFNNPDVLIFDESTNALDFDTEKKIVDLIHNLKSENKTIIFVSHRKSTLEKCDSIYLLKDKKLELN